MGLDPVTAVLLGTGLKVGGSIYNKNQQAKQQGKMLRNRMDTLEEYGIHPLQAAGMGGGTISGTGGSNIGSMVSDALQSGQAIKDKKRAQAMEDARFDLNSRHMESQILTNNAVAAKTQEEAKNLEADRYSPYIIRGETESQVFPGVQDKSRRGVGARISNSFTPAIDSTMRDNNPFRR